MQAGDAPQLSLQLQQLRAGLLEAQRRLCGGDPEGAVDPGAESAPSEPLASQVETVRLFARDAVSLLQFARDHLPSTRDPGFELVHDAFGALTQAVRESLVVLRQYEAADP
jgi:hypothetical protein